MVQTRAKEKGMRSRRRKRAAMVPLLRVVPRGPGACGFEVRRGELTVILPPGFDLDEAKALLAVVFS